MRQSRHVRAKTSAIESQGRRQTACAGVIYTAARALDPELHRPHTPARAPASRVTDEARLRLLRFGLWPAGF